GMRAAHLLVTRGRDGLTLWSAGAATSLAAWGGEEAVDVTGAGDAVVATATLALAAGAKPLEAAALANVAGSVAVGRRGAVAVRAGADGGRAGGDGGGTARGRCGGDLRGADRRPPARRPASARAREGHRLHRDLGAGGRHHGGTRRRDRDRRRREGPREPRH